MFINILFFIDDFILLLFGVRLNKCLLDEVLDICNLFVIFLVGSFFFMDKYWVYGLRIVLRSLFVMKVLYIFVVFGLCCLDKYVSSMIV